MDTSIDYILTISCVCVYVMACKKYAQLYAIAVQCFIRFSKNLSFTFKTKQIARIINIHVYNILWYSRMNGKRVLFTE